MYCFVLWGYPRRALEIPWRILEGPCVLGWFAPLPAMGLNRLRKKNVLFGVVGGEVLGGLEGVLRRPSGGPWVLGWFATQNGVLRCRPFYYTQNQQHRLRISVALLFLVGVGFRARV